MTNSDKLARMKEIWLWFQDGLKMMQSPHLIVEKQEEFEKLGKELSVDQGRS